MSDNVRLVCATRLSRDEFWQKSLLGRSLSLFRNELLPELTIQYDNRPTEHRPAAEGLPAIYNRIIDNSAEPGVHLLFVHDDVFIHDVFLVERLLEAFQRFDIVGLAGSRSNDLDQPSWALEFDPDTLVPLGWQKHGLFAGAVSHRLAPIERHPPEPELGIYGPLVSPCTLLDGLFLAVRSPILGRYSGLRFDERFDFHHYDIDFCRQATEIGLSLGTWPILVTHASGGNFASEAFRASARSYLAKWNVRRFERELGFTTNPLIETNDTT